MVDVPEAVGRGFVSYRRDDNDDFGGVVDRICTDLSSMYEAKTGERLELFLDRDSIGWGEDWREKIAGSVRAATVFIPVITLRYFNSQNCLDELLAFESTARSLGATDLILPLVLFGSDQIRDEDERPEVRMIARLNYRSIEDAWLAGYDSPQWRQIMTRCASELAASLKSIEATLEKAGGEVAVGPSPSDPSPEEGEHEVSFDLDVMGSQMQKVTATLEEASKEIEALGKIIGTAFPDGEDSSSLSPAQVNARVVATAQKVKEPAKRLEQAGALAEATLSAVDPQLRAAVRELKALSIPEAQEQLAGLLSGLDDSDGSLAETEATISNFIEMIQFLSVMNVSIRKALRPAQRGMRSTLSALRIFRAWEDLR